MSLIQRSPVRVLIVFLWVGTRASVTAASWTLGTPAHTIRFPIPTHGPTRLKHLTWVIPLLLLLYLVAWPVDIRPVAWNPPEAPALDEGLYARDDALRGVQRIADGAVVGPEAIAFDADGRLYTGLEDGRVVSMTAEGTDCRVLGNTGGRPLGLHVQADGSLLIADAKKGLLHLRTDGRVETRLDSVDGIALAFADDLVVDGRGRPLLSDGSFKHGYGEHVLDALEHRARGRLVLYDPVQEAAATVLAELHFANGVALGPDEQYVLVNETTAYRVTRYWLKGERAGQREVFAENLPGFPDNLTFNGSDRFWVALYGPRDAMLDALAPIPFLRTVIARLPRAMVPDARRQGFVLGLDLDGRVVEQYRYAGRGAYGPVTSVCERDGMLYLGSLSETAIGRISLAELRAGKASSEPPPPIKSQCAS
jgi:sugar lactone lactonase YvrE